jgi:hypothetical protein
MYPESSSTVMLAIAITVLAICLLAAGLLVGTVLWLLL